MSKKIEIVAKDSKRKFKLSLYSHILKCCSVISNMKIIKAIMEKI